MYRNSWRTRDEAENAILAYIDGWYNPRRIQKELDYLSPDEYEATWRQTHIDQEDSTRTSPAPAGAR